MPNNNINQDHVYETSLLGWAIQEVINSGTDWYTPAAFQHERDAQNYREHLESLDPSGVYIVARIGTLHDA